MPQFNPTSDVTINMKGSAGGPSNNAIRIWSGVMTPTVAIGQLIDYSAAGFTSITNVTVVAQRDVTDPLAVPNVAIKGVPSATSCTVNITQGNSATVAILGINVLSGGPAIAATPLTNITLYVRVEGY